MWEARASAREVSKGRWKSFFDFHGTGISTARARGHRAASARSRPKRGFSRGRYDSPSMTRS